MSAAHASLDLGIIVESQVVDHPWIDRVWRATEAVRAIAPACDWQKLIETPDCARFYARTLRLDLFRRDTEGYRLNLAQTRPQLFVVMRGIGSERPEPFAVTACPYEAEDYEIGGDERVDAVHMDPFVMTFAAHFVADHHKDEPFHKRKRGPKSPASDKKESRRGVVGRPYG